MHFHISLRSIPLFFIPFPVFLLLFSYFSITCFPSLLARHGALVVIAFRYSPTTLLPSYIFQIFSSNLSKPITRGGIKWSLCRSNSLGTSHSTQGRDDSSSSSTAGLHCTVLHSSIYRCAVRPYVAINISIRYGSKWVTFCCSYVFCHKMVTNGRILVFEVSIEPY